MSVWRISFTHTFFHFLITKYCKFFFYLCLVFFANGQCKVPTEICTYKVTQQLDCSLKSTPLSHGILSIHCRSTKQPNRSSHLSIYKHYPRSTYPKIREQYTQGLTSSIVVEYIRDKGDESGSIDGSLEAEDAEAWQLGRRSLSHTTDKRTNMKLQGFTGHRRKRLGLNLLDELSMRNLDRVSTEIEL